MSSVDSRRMMCVYVSFDVIVNALKESGVIPPDAVVDAATVDRDVNGYSPDDASPPTKLMLRVASPLLPIVHPAYSLPISRPMMEARFVGETRSDPAPLTNFLQKESDPQIPPELTLRFRADLWRMEAESLKEKQIAEPVAV